MAPTRGKVSEELRQAIIDDTIMYAGTPEGSIAKTAKRCLTRNDVVYRVRKKAGLSGIHDANAPTMRAAVEARQLDNATRRCELVKRLLDVAENALDDLNESEIVFSFGGKENAYNQHTFPRPTISSRATLVKTAAQAITSSLRLEEFDTEKDQSAAAVDGWLSAMAGGSDPLPVRIVVDPAADATNV